MQTYKVGGKEEDDNHKGKNKETELLFKINNCLLLKGSISVPINEK